VREPSADNALPKVAALLFGGLRAGTQGPVRRHIVSGAHHHLADTILRAHIPSGAHHVRRHGGERLRAIAVRHDHDGHHCRHDAGIQYCCLFMLLGLSSAMMIFYPTFDGC